MKVKKEGDIDEKDADPIPLSLHQSMSKLGIETNNALVWFWTLVQWNRFSGTAWIGLH